MEKNPENTMDSEESKEMVHQTKQSRFKLSLFPCTGEGSNTAVQGKRDVLDYSSKLGTDPEYIIRVDDGT